MLLTKATLKASSRCNLVRNILWSPQMSNQVSLETLSARFQRVRELSEELVEPLETEDLVVQTCADVSPMKWHLAHTSWFFETFVLQVYIPGYKSFNTKYSELFNSYYNSVGAQFFRPNRGTLSRPTVKEVMKYRQVITSQTIDLLTSLPQEILHPNSVRVRNQSLCCHLQYYICTHRLLL